MNRNLLPCVLLLNPWLVQAISARQADGTLLARTLVEPGPSASPTTLEMAGEVSVEQIVYASDGLEVEGYLILPKVKADSPWPAIIYCRGGNRDFGAISKDGAFRWLGNLARHGYVVVASQYRGNGEFWQEKYPGDHNCPACKQAVGGLGREEFGGKEVEDVLALVPLLESLPEADASRLGIWGHSRGGMMTYLALRKTERFKAAVVGAGVSDVGSTIEERPLMEHVFADLAPGWDDPEKRRAAIESRSAVLWADELPEQVPILIMHGTADWRVAPTQALDMSRALLKAKRPFRLIMLEGADHGFSEYQEVYHSTVREWFDHYVRDQGSFPSLELHGR